MLYKTFAQKILPAVVLLAGSILPFSAASGQPGQGILDGPYRVGATPPPLVNATTVRTAGAAGTRVGLQRRTIITPGLAANFSMTNEPSLAVNGQEIFVTGNFYAAYSTNGGQTWQFVDPSGLPASSFGAFCCDQQTIYLPAEDLLIWLLQYDHDGNQNVLRLAVADANARAQWPIDWTYYDLPVSAMSPFPGNQLYFDYNHLFAAGDRLFITSNLNTADANDAHRFSLIFGIPLSALTDLRRLSFDFTISDRVLYGGFMPIHGAAVGTFGAFLRPNYEFLRILTWMGGATPPAPPRDIPLIGADYDWSADNYVAQGPNHGANWLGTIDASLTAAWQVGDLLGFAWTAAADARHTLPYVRVLIVRQSTGEIIARPDIWNPSYAYAYPYAVPNPDGEIGISLNYGGGTHNPSHAVGILVHNGGTDYSWNLVESARGQSEPQAEEWGDYLNVRTGGDDPNHWFTVGFTLQTGQNGRAPADLRLDLVEFWPNSPAP